MAADESIISHYKKYFYTTYANTEALKADAYKLRYQVLKPCGL